MGYLDDFDINEMKSEMENDARGRALKTWQPEEGETAVRILPPLKKLGEKKKFWFTYNQHWINRNQFLDTRQELVDKDGNLHKPERNPIQELSDKLYQSSERGSEEFKLAGQIRSKPRYVFRVVVRGKENEVQPVFWEVGKSLFNKIKNIVGNTKVGLSLIDPSSKGRDFIIVKSGQGLTTNYDDSQADIETSPLFDTSEKVKECLNKAEKLDYNSLIEFKPVEEMQQAIDILLGKDEAVTARKKVNPPQFESENSNDNYEEDDEDYSDDLDEEKSKQTEDDDDMDAILDEFVG